MLYIILIMLLPALLGIGWSLTELIRRSGFKGLKMELEFHQSQELNESSQVIPTRTTENTRSLLRSRND